MKIYIVKISGGTYEDSWESVKKVYLDKNKANEFKDNYNKKLAQNKKKDDKCCKCISNYKSYKCFKPNKEYPDTCDNNVSFMFYENWDAEVEEYEVIQ